MWNTLTQNTFSTYSLSVQETIKRVRPGLSGVGSIIFRGEEEIMHGMSASIDFYKNVISPYKGALEEWFVINKSLYLYFLCIILTIWVVIRPSSKASWRALKGLWCL